MKIGCFLEDLDGRARVLIEKDERRQELQMEKRVIGGKQKFWIEEKKPQVSQEQEESAPEQNNLVENGITVDEVPLEEIQTEQMIGLMERITTLEKEN